MKIKFERKSIGNPLTVLRRCGYKPWRDPRTGKESFIRRVSAAFYPRFHVLTYYKENLFIIDLHFDARRPMHRRGIRSYEDEESETVRQEAERIKQLIEKM